MTSEELQFGACLTILRYYGAEGLRKVLDAASKVSHSDGLNFVPDKERERWHFELLRNVLPEFPDGSLEDNHERPDFIIHAEGKKVGIEVTTFDLPKVPGQRPRSEVQSLKRRVVDLARQKHKEAGGPALYVSVHFQHEPGVTKANTQTRADELLRAVQEIHLPSSINEARTDTAWPSWWPEGIAKISLTASVDGKDSHWHASAVGWVIQLQPADIQRVIDKKRKMFAGARAKCDELWLVIVNDLSRTEPVALNGPVANAVFTQPFDRVLWFEPHLQKAWLLGTAEVFDARARLNPKPATQ